jgi:2-polyprenyl-3-methyl-5-hydroxy-6-metoxy-1,4-benzoquinol methylase
MKTILCPLCEVNHSRVVNERRDRGLWVTTVACLSCGLVYHNPVIEDQDRKELAISPRQWHTGTALNARQLRKLERRWSLQWPLIQQVFQPRSLVLEIGCGLGLAGGRLKSLGGEVWGVEPDPEQAAFARDYWGLTIFPVPFERVDLSGERFDLILASHVIEHFPDPLAFLFKARTLAHPETRLFLETPNILAPKVSFRRLFSLAHNFYFSPQTLSWLLEKAGWRVCQLRVWRRDSFQLLAQASAPRSPEVPPEANESLKAIARHRYLYYLKLLFIWRKIPWWQKYWMYTPDRRYERQKI